MSTNKLSTRVSTREAAKILQIRPNLLEMWRSKGFGPPYWKVLRSVRYDRAELLKWWRETAQRHIVPRATLPTPRPRKAASRKVTAPRRRKSAPGRADAAPP